ncbi:MAG: hypothetical protein BMS9Abin05_0373 [Rhodothermia bacterium]|nr:MAG: hypothetical protein BMS9Abin05_0373 [Rhodothermia bacterium]
MAGLTICTFVYLPTPSAVAQNAFTFGSRIYADYSYVIKSASGEEDGDNAFGYRRVYFTANYVKSERFSGRFRLEAKDSSTNTQGKPAPFVKDLYLKWKGALGAGHDVTMGVSKPPSWGVSESVWGYRSLIKSPQDRGKILSSRDIGVAISGPVTSDGKVRYGAMFGNNESVSRETDKHKRLYGQFEYYPTDELSFTLGGDFASFEDGSAINVNAFAAYSSLEFRVGVEGYFSPRSFDASSDELVKTGISVFVVAQPSKASSAIIRIDRLAQDFLGVRTTETMILAGVSFKVERGVEIIPNVLISKESEQNDPSVTGRMTLYVKI